MKTLLFALFLSFCFQLLHAQEIVDQNKSEKRNITKELNMTPEQEKEYSLLKENRHLSNKPIHDSISFYRREMRTRMNDQDFTKEQMFSYIDRIGTLKVKAQKVNADFMFGMKEILTPDQFSRFSDIRKEQSRNLGLKHNGKVSQPGKNIQR